ncbi:PDZ domain-containing protein [Aliiglaciecola sp. 3_MG-2023]|uniref:M61 family metallopeptidase n=1 Tax=Aliiglaciecola sp. 3_MG-2023 TaxID=3062644 RepID=UPI0026E41634|nr:PDZ domain-containing protein [Aliiglaciecola sp. 3_MG-2023]MDO6693418.1 PDZ domain-containing protein [Aliiglaciecola sp. 3_MG-2023]
MQTSEQVHYSVTVDSIAGHTFKIVQTINITDQGNIKFKLPAWIPGSYMIRDFAKNVVSLKAYDDDLQSLKIEKLDKQSWQVTPGKGKVHIESIVYAFDLSVRSAYICDEYAFFNGTSVFFEVEGYSGPCSVDVSIPDAKLDSWSIATAMLQTHTHKSTQSFKADNYQSLIDHPLILGELDIVYFSVKDVKFEFILTGSHQTDMDRICRDLPKICDHHLSLFDENTPVERYLFITLLCAAGFGGLEHSHSTVLQFPRNQLPSKAQQHKMPDGYRTFLSLCSHELFHTWHVKRTKPAEFINLDLSRETYSEQLWIYEGFTSYIDDLSLLRCGLIDVTSYFEVLGQTLTRLKRNPGNLKQTVTESSYDAWTRFYQQDASAANNIVSYYAKGAEIALCLDLLIRKESNNNYSIFDLLKILWQRFGSVNIGTQNDSIHKILKNDLHVDLDNFLERALYSTSPIPTEQLLAEFGVTLHCRARKDVADKGGMPAQETLSVDFGATFEATATGISIMQVLEDSAAYEAGLQVKDNLVAIEEWQVSKDSFFNVLENYQDQSQVRLHVFRDGKLKTFTMPIRSAVKDTLYLTTSNEQKQALWLNS